MAILGAGAEGNEICSKDVLGAVLTARIVPVGSVLFALLRACCCSVIFPSPPAMNLEIACSSMSEILPALVQMNLLSIFV